MDVDQIMIDSKQYLGDYEDGQSIPSPIPKVHLYEKIHGFPFQCDASLVGHILTATGVPGDSIPQINYCMSIESSTGAVFNLYIQDSIASYVEEEYKQGSKIHLYAMWIFVNISDKKPYFLVNGIGE